MTLYLGENLISGVAIPVEGARNIGQIVQSTLPLNDAGLHLIDGALIYGSGIYADFVDKIASQYNEQITSFNQPILSSNGTLGAGNFAIEGRNYSSQYMYLAFDGNDSTYWETYNYAQTDTCYIYNENYLNVNSIVISSIDNKGWTSITISGSNDNINYFEEQTITSTNTTNTDKFICNFRNYYKYYKIVYTNRYTSTGGYYAQITNFAINGEQKTISKGFILEEEWQASVINYGVCGKFVYNATANTIRLPKRYSAERYLIKAYKQGNDWYRIYSDGWCEQGGFVNNTTAVKTIQLLKAYIDTNYSVLATSRYSASDATLYQPHVEILNTTSFKCASYGERGGDINNNGAAVFWEASGYIDISDYQISPLYEYIVLATSAKTDIEVNIDNIATDLNGKADIDGTNMVASVKNFDGQPVVVNQVVYNSTSSGTVDLSTIIPNDGNVYECNFFAKVSKNSASGYMLGHYTMNGQEAEAQGAGDLWNSYQNFTFYTNANDRILEVSTTANATWSEHFVKLQSYRRVGTNE